jgi:hypothetical protein
MGRRILCTQKACRLRTYLLVGLVALGYVSEEQLHDFLEDFGLDACCGQSASIGHGPITLFGWAASTQRVHCCKTSAAKNT